MVGGNGIVGGKVVRSFMFYNLACGGSVFCGEGSKQNGNSADRCRFYIPPKVLDSKLAEAFVLQKV